MLMPDASNPRGYFEDVEFMKINIRMLYDSGKDILNKPILRPPTTDDLEAFEELVLERNSKHDIWGMKDPRFILTLEHFLPILERHCDVRKITTRRNREAIHASLFKRDEPHGLSSKECWDTIGLYHSALGKMSAGWGGPWIVVNYDDLVDQPWAEVSRIFNFIGDYSIPVWQSEWRVKKAASHIDPALRHWRTDGNSS
jgi:hypothetical protein